MLGSLIAYDAAGNVIATLDNLVQRDERGVGIGLCDFAAHEAAGGKLRDLWSVSGAAGSGTWPEWIGAAAHEHRVELTGKRITALVHKTSGHRRERAHVEAAIAHRIAATPPGEAADLRDIIGGPAHPLILDADGRTVPRATPPRRPLVNQRPNA